MDSGCAAVICLIVGNTLITANVGDCRAILSKDGKAMLLSVDQKPYNPKEKKRIEEAGGKVELNRISG